MIEKQKTPLKAIRLKCLECSAGNVTVVKNCIIKDCYLFPYRFGTNPKRKGVSGGLDNFLGTGVSRSKTAKSPIIVPRSHELAQVAILSTLARFCL